MHKLLAKGIAVAFIGGAISAVSVYEYFTQPTEDRLKISEANFLFAIGLIGSIFYSISEIRNIANELHAERHYIPWTERVRLDEQNLRR